MKTYKITPPIASTMLPDEYAVDGLTLYYPPETGIQPGKIRLSKCPASVLWIKSDRPRSAILACYRTTTSDVPLFFDDLDLTEKDLGIIKVCHQSAREIWPEYYTSTRAA